VGTLFVVATPIGNLDDWSPRAIQTLREVDVIAAEDTRHSRRLLTHFEIHTPLVSYHQHNRRERENTLLRSLETGDVALITDAGTPAISDPGTDLVAAARAAGHRVSPIPGPSALTAALSASGLINGPFLVLGFLPRETLDRRRILGRAAATGYPLVLFESAHRLKTTLGELVSSLGHQQAVVLRELTKLHEEVRAGSLEDLREWAGRAVPRGEIVVVTAGAVDVAASDLDAAAVIASLRQSGLTPSQAAREAAAITGLPRSDLYRLAREIVPARSVGLEGELALPNEDALQDAFSDKESPK
jgi:16S rRNA (cytidine1402-2'-O)-methyltransferase